MYAVIRNYQNEAPDILDQIRTLRMASKMSSEVSKVPGLLPARHVGRWFRNHQRVRGQGWRGGVYAGRSQLGAENIADWTPNPPMIIQGDVAISLAR